MTRPVMYAGKNIIGKRYGRLVVKKASNRRNFSLMVECLCDCGKSAIIRAGNLGRTKSCGCYRREVWDSTGCNRKHGYDIRDNVKSEYHAWANMKKPGRYPESIKVCRKWSGTDGFLNFIADMKDKPSPFCRLERINKNKGFSSKNCQWRHRALK